MQRVTGNPMASPEVLGISAGASFGLIVLIFIAPAAGYFVQTGVAGAGAFITLLIMVTLGQRHGFAPERMLLMGIALGTAFSALATCVSMIFLAAVAPFFARWLDILPLGETVTEESWRRPYL